MRVYNIIIGLVFCALLFSCKESNSYQLDFVENEALHVSKHDNRIIIYSSSDTLAELEYKNGNYQLRNSEWVVMSKDCKRFFNKKSNTYTSIQKDKSGDYLSFTTIIGNRIIGIDYDSCFNIQGIYNYKSRIFGYDFPDDIAKDYRLMDWEKVEEHRPCYSECY